MDANKRLLRTCSYMCMLNDKTKEPEKERERREREEEKRKKEKTLISE